jgi:uncharacterized lipoprotein YddW (UPF0748 family)
VPSILDRFRPARAPSASVIAAAVLAACAPLASATVIDSFDYPSEKAAQSAWRAIDQSPPALPGPEGGLLLRCPFSGSRDRVYWDRDVSLNLSGSTSIELDVECDRPEALRSFALYFESGGGWYIWNKPLREAGRHVVSIRKDEFAIEGHPAGWHQIQRLRLSPWKGSAADARIVVRGLAGRSDSVFVVRPTLSVADATEKKYALRTCDRVTAWMSDLGIPHAVTEEGRLDAVVSSATLLVLPYNPYPDAAMMAALRRFVGRGGKLLVFYGASPELAALMGLRLGDYTRSVDPSRWNAIVFSDPERWHVPSRVFQLSSNIRPVYAAGEQGQVIARWANSRGEPSGDPAWVATGRGLWMTHVLLDDDELNKQQMVLGLIGSLAPDVWPRAARRALDSAGKIDSYSSLGSAAADIRRTVAGSAEAGRVEQVLAEAEALHARLRELYNRRNYAEAVDQCRKLRSLLTEAYARAQPPRPGEFRGVWDHEGTGWYPGDWDNTCRILRENGITAVFPNMLWTGRAHYPSAVVPSSDTARRFGDQMEACLKAAHRNGLQVHVWKVCWNAERAPPGFIDEMKKAGRLQMSADGKTLPWLNPAHPENVRLELSAIEELVRKYPVDGIHLDYIRYPGGNYCFAPQSRRSFEQWLGGPARGWPRSAMSGGALRAKYARWRTDGITSFVRSARDLLRSINPKVRLSAAVWGGYPDTIDSIGQDWGAWLREGLVDFVCPMDYTEDTFRFAAQVNRQLALPRAAGHVYPGLGVTSAESQLPADKVIEQIASLRRAGAAGFMLFDMSHTLREETFPALRLGATRPTP